MTNKEIIFSLPDKDWLGEASRKARKLYMEGVANETPHDIVRTQDETVDEPIEGEVVNDKK